MSYYVVTAFIAPNDCQAICVGATFSEALSKFQTWITRGESLENLPDADIRWINEAKSNLRNFGLSQKQDSGCHYRLDICY